MELVNICAKMLISFVVLASILGCQTTGDPKAGGLFGWSENKAKVRQEHLAERVGQTQEEVANSEQENTKLEADNANLKKEKVRLEEVLAQLIDEQVTLRNQLASLKAKFALSTQELTKIHQDNPWLSKTREQVVQEFREFRREDRFQQQLKNMEDSNKKLTQEIILLIGR